jgi:class 3 adenylate cyclase
MFESITPAIQSNIDARIQETIILSVVLVVLTAISELCSYQQLQSIDDHLRAVLEMLLHVPVDVVQSVPKIVQTLSGDFSSSNREGAHRAAQFLDTVFSNLPDAVMYGRSVDQKIEGASDSCKALFGCDDIIGRSMKDFYNPERFRGDVHALFAGRAIKTLAFKAPDGSDAHYEVTSSHSNEKLIISAQDITQTVRYNTLIAAEQAKSDALLATILPPSLVKRVQAGEQNISFAVQSASISFIDIVEFTPWCGSLPAATVMSTLNLLFKKFDECVSERATMTKIKCIGDCYMSAGGIFSEMNQPGVHAKEMVSFGLAAIASIQELNREVNQTLRIRVGVNTGGPIVAGVLGVGKPTFEILGPAINMAQQMEHHGVPMQVHVSRAVYELVYGDAFSIKERGAVQINTGEVITYLVSPKPD